MAWREGPLPAGTWGWGAVVRKGDKPEWGFYFADFHGDHVTAVGAGPGGSDVELRAEDVAQYNNCLLLPPLGGCKGRAGATP